MRYCATCAGGGILFRVFGVRESAYDCPVCGGTGKIAAKVTEGVAQLDDKGRCCGRKPIEYKNHDYGTDGFKFCPRCDRAYDRETGEQIDNWAWKKNAAGAFECQTNRKAAV